MSSPCAFAPLMRSLTYSYRPPPPSPPAPAVASSSKSSVPGPQYVPFLPGWAVADSPYLQPRHPVPRKRPEPISPSADADCLLRSNSTTLRLPSSPPRSSRVHRTTTYFKILQDSRSSATDGEEWSALPHVREGSREAASSRSSSASPNCTRKETRD